MYKTQVTEGHQKVKLSATVIMSHATEDCYKLERLLWERNGHRSLCVLYLARPAL